MMKKQKGIALIAALCIIIVVGIISAFVCRVAVVSNKVANRGGTTLESRANAESALNAAYMSLAGRLDDLEDEARTAGVNTRRREQMLRHQPRGLPLVAVRYRQCGQKQVGERKQFQRMAL